MQTLLAWDTCDGGALELGAEGTEKCAVPGPGGASAFREPMGGGVTVPSCHVRKLGLREGR